jgi:hypothetical protein
MRINVPLSLVLENAQSHQRVPRRGRCPGAGRPIHRRCRDGSLGRVGGRIFQMRDKLKETCFIVFTCHSSSRKELAPMDKAQAEALASKHAALHAMIDEEEHRPHPNEDLLHQLKKEKLRLKDELAGHYEH